MIIQDENPAIADIIRNDFYVDLLTGADTIDQVRSIKRDISQILITRGFPLRKWNTNTPAIFEERCEINSGVDRPIGKEVKTLGLYWNPKDDVFRYKRITNKRVTKKNLSLISQIYNPLGLVRPACIKAKIILQHLWRKLAGTNHFSLIYTRCGSSTIAFQYQLSAIIAISRVIVCANPTRIELHGFCDASESVYGACVFIKFISTSGEHTMKLHSKSRIDHSRFDRHFLKIRIMRSSVTRPARTQDHWSFNFNNRRETLWVWLPNRFGLDSRRIDSMENFANRVAEIHRLTNKNYWHHIRSRKDPADIISRGIQKNWRSVNFGGRVHRGCHN